MKKQRHSVDYLFVLTLFLVFAFCILSVVYIGSHVYSTTVDTMEESFNNSTTLNYIIEKVKQNNHENALTIKTIENQEVLCLYSKENNEDYVTYIYEYEESLRELFVLKNQSISLDEGEQLMNIDSLSFKIDQDLLEINLTLNDTTHRGFVHFIKEAIYEEK